MKSLYLSDLDGTLLNRQQRISDFSRNAINRLVEQGLLFSIATARSWSSAKRVVQGLRLLHPLVLYNGAFLLDARTNRVLSGVHFQEEQKKELTALFMSQGISPLVYALQDGEEKVSWLQALENEGVKRYLAQRPGDERFTPLAMEEKERLYRGQVFYFSCIGKRQELLPLWDAVKDDPRFNCLFHRELYSTEYWCEIMPRAATKAEGALRLKKLLGAERMVCFGDQVNDLPLFSVCDEAYAVENAVEEVKRAATGVIPSNEEDGVARFLLREAQR